MGSQSLPLQTKGIFRNLPTFSPDIRGLSAIVTGANGISGFHTMRVLLESPTRWKKVWAASRRPPPKEMMDLLPPDQRDRVEHVACDFLSNPEDIAKQLKNAGVTADYIFFYSYAQPKPQPGAAQWSNADELAEVNAALLENFLRALDLSSIVPKRFLLQTGAKNYGLHLGVARTPYVESDPRVTLETNFYYPQEDLLFEYCKKHGITWNIICPAWIIGAVNNAAMNALHVLAVYAAIQAHKSETLEFPGDIRSWLTPAEHSTAMLTGYLSEWAVLEEKCADEKFNASDTSVLPNNRLWPELARWYGCKASGIPELDESELITIDPGAGKPQPLGYGPSAKMRFRFSLSHWAQREENQKAWKEIMQKHGLTHDPFEDIENFFWYGDAVCFTLAGQLSMNKAMNFGWTGHVDTLESLHLAYSELAKLKMLPPMVADAKQLI